MFGQPEPFKEIVFDPVGRFPFFVDLPVLILRLPALRFAVQLFKRVGEFPIGPVNIEIDRIAVFVRAVEVDARNPVEKACTQITFAQSKLKSFFAGTV